MRMPAAVLASREKTRLAFVLSLSALLLVSLPYGEDANNILTARMRNDNEELP